MTKDYSRKPYRTKYSYPEMIRYTPARAFWNSVTEQQPVFSEYGTRGQSLTALERRYLQYIKQSEAKKPYLSDDYETMEEVWEGLPGLMDDNPHIDHPWMPDPQPTQIDEIIPAGPGFWILQAFTEDKWCKGITQEIQINATHPIYELEFQFPGTLEPGTTFSIVSGIGTPTVVISLTVDLDETGLIGMRAYLEAFDAPPQPSTQGRGWTAFNIPEQLQEEKCPVFIFHLTLANGDAIAPTVPNFQVFDSGGSSVSNIRYYDAGQDVFVIHLHTTDPSEIDPNGYHVFYPASGITYGVTTQYPFKYKTADLFQPGDLIDPGEYTDQMHYFRSEKYEDQTKYPCNTQFCPDVWTGGNGWCELQGSQYPVGTCTSGGTFIAARNYPIRNSGLTVFASVEYTMTYKMAECWIVPHYIVSSPPLGGGCAINCDSTRSNIDPPAPSPTFELGTVTISSTDGAFAPVTKGPSTGTLYYEYNASSLFRCRGASLFAMWGGVTANSGFGPKVNFIDTTYDELTPVPAGKIHAWTIDASAIFSLPPPAGFSAIGFIQERFDIIPTVSPPPIYHTPQISVNIKLT